MTQRVALVTGANKGIGFEGARGVAKAGYAVLLGARNPTAGREAADVLRSERFDVRFVELDVTRRETISAAVGRIEAEFGKLDVLVNNAGIADPNDGPPSRRVLTPSSACCKQIFLVRWRWRKRSFRY
jgi:NAD(P)-dependent dehydrogenase (short-subunit alcohol dehydrogenase family)